MATYYVWSGATGSATGADWTNAFTTLAAGVAALTGDGDIIKVHYASTIVVSSDTTYTISYTCQILSVNKDSSDALTVMGTTGYIGHTSSNYSLKFQPASGVKCYIYGLTLKVANGSGNDVIQIGASTGAQEVVAESCIFDFSNATSRTSSHLQISSSSTSSNTKATLRGCTWKPGNASQKIDCRGGQFIFDNLSVDTSVVQPTKLFDCEASPQFDVIDSDLSNYTGTLFSTPSGVISPRLINCKLHASVTIFSTTSTNEGGSSVNVLNTASGDTHYKFEYYTPIGSLVTQTTVYANDGAAFDGTNKCAWKVDTNSYTTFYHPFKTPWIDLYWDGTSAITPYIEIVRDGSATAWKDDEVWLEIGYQGTTGYTLGTKVNDSCSIATHLAGSASNQASSSLGAGDWTGESATAWFGKLQVSSITPAEIGMLRARVCVAVNTSTTSLYIDPQIRT